MVEKVQQSVSSDMRIYQGIKPDLEQVKSDLAENTKQLDFLALKMNVKYYGAIGDGLSHPLSEKYSTLAEAQAVYPHATSLTDEIDWCATQKTHNNLPSSGGYVVFPSGTYKFNKPLSVTKSKVVIKGEGFNTILQASGTSQNQITFGLIEANISGSANFVVEGLVLQMFEADSLLASGVKALSVVTDIVIRNCWFTQTNKAISGDFITLNFSNNIVELCKSGGVIAEGSNFRKIVISDNNFFANNGAHVRIKNTHATNRDMHNITITGNGFDQGLSSGFVTGFTSTGNGVELEKVDLFVIEGNYFNGYTPVIGAYPEQFQIGHGIKATNCNKFTIGVNTYSKYNNSAIYIDTCNDFNVKGGVGEGLKAEGVAVLNSNDFEIDTKITGAKIGMVVNTSNRFTLRGSYNNNLEHGVTLNGSKQGKVECSANINNKNGLTQRYGIYVYGTSDRIRVLNADSHVTDTTGVGQETNIVLASTTTNCKISNSNAFPFKTSAIINNGTGNTVDTNNVVA